MPEPTIANRIMLIKQRIADAERRQNSGSARVTLLAVSKTKPLSAIHEAYVAGQRHFAENYAQESFDKIDSCDFGDLTWHFIGPIQSNKTRGIAERFDWVHTIEREKIAIRLNEQRPKDKPPLNVLIQVNISDDPAKAGVKPSQIEALAQKISALPNLTLKGLMAIPAAGLPVETLSAQYTELKKHQLALIQHHSACTELSIGMSGDFELAIASGATMVRIGSDIFGARSQP